MPPTILVARNHYDSTCSLVSRLREAGYDASGFTEALGAWEALNCAPKLDLLISDIYLGSGRVNGVALARAARTERPALSVLLLAGAQALWLVEGFADCLPISSNDQQILQRAESILERGRPPPRRATASCDCRIERLRVGK